MTDEPTALPDPVDEEALELDEDAAYEVAPGGGLESATVHFFEHRDRPPSSDDDVDPELAAEAEAAEDTEGV